MTYHDALMNQLTTLVTHVRKLRQRLQQVDNTVYKVSKPVFDHFYIFFEIVIHQLNEALWKIGEDDSQNVSSAVLKKEQGASEIMDGA